MIHNNEDLETIIYLEKLEELTKCPFVSIFFYTGAEGQPGNMGNIKVNLFISYIDTEDKIKSKINNAFEKYKEVTVNTNLFNNLKNHYDKLKQTNTK
jgi:hypothetical protein